MKSALVARFLAQLIHRASGSDMRKNAEKLKLVNFARQVRFTGFLFLN